MRPAFSAARKRRGWSTSAAALQQDPRLTAGVRTVLDRLLSLLTLEHVHDPHRMEMAYLVAIDPADPAV
jgi:hypothetical protein